MPIAARLSRWRPRAALPWLILTALVALVTVLFLIDQQGVGSAAGEWTVIQVTEGSPAGPRLIAKPHDRLTVRQNGYVSLTGAEGRLGVLARAFCGWNCFTLHRIRVPNKFRAALGDDLNSLTLTGSGGFVMRTQRRPAP